MLMNKKSIVFNADNNYVDKLETAIKSICCHNNHLKFYVFNDDIASEWFLMMNKRLKTIQSEIVNVKIVDHVLKKFHLPLKNLSYATFFRYFIPNFVKESRALYIDSDTIVTGSLDYLFDMDLDGYALAAVEDSFGDAPSTNFNAGVLLVDVDIWRDEDACTKLLELTNQYHETAYGDQGILNMLFHDRWKKLDRTFNFMVGMDSIAHIEGNQRWYEISKLKNGDLPSVIHYTGVKPWEMIANNRFREVWWFYNLLEWSDILLRKDIINRSFKELVYSPKAHTAILTASCEMEHVEYLIENLPEVHFSILAHTYFASNVVALLKYSNVTIYPCFSPFDYQKMLDNLDFYLDINHYQEVDNIVSVVQQLSKPIFAFENTSHDIDNQTNVFSSTEPNKMLEAIRQFLGE